MKNATIALLLLALCAPVNASAQQTAFGISNPQTADCSTEGSVTMTLTPLSLPGAYYKISLFRNGAQTWILGTQPIDSTLAMAPGTIFGTAFFYNSDSIQLASIAQTTVIVSPRNCFVTVACEGNATVIHPSNGEVTFHVNGEQTTTEEFLLGSTAYVEAYTGYGAQVFAQTVLDTCGTTTGTPERPERPTPTVFPNPATDGSVTILAEGYDEYAIYDVLGELRQSARFEMSGKAIIDLRGLPSGRYIAHVSSATAHHIIRFVVL